MTLSTLPNVDNINISHQVGITNLSNQGGTDPDYLYEAADPARREQMDWLRRTVRDLLNPEMAGHGGDHSSVGQGNNITLPKRGTDPDYLLRRLKRDAPEAAAIAPARGGGATGGVLVHPPSRRVLGPLSASAVASAGMARGVREATACVASLGLSYSPAPFFRNRPVDGFDRSGRVPRPDLHDAGVAGRVAAVQRRPFDRGEHQLVFFPFKLGRGAAGGEKPGA